MSRRFTNLRVKNYRSLADIDLPLTPVTVVFGPNGVGKSTLLDTIWFVRDCAINGVSSASSNRSHGIGMLWDSADDNAVIAIELRTQDLGYELCFGFSAGRIEPMLGETLFHRGYDNPLITRAVGANRAAFYFPNEAGDGVHQALLREPYKPSISPYYERLEGGSDKALDGWSTEGDLESALHDLDAALHFVQFHDCRSFVLHRLKKHGSESGFETRIGWRGQNLWSVIRNLKDRREVDTRYDTIMKFMRKAFPRTFMNVLLMQTGPNSVYASFQERGLREPIHASGVSDGHVQMLLLLTILFSEGPERPALLILDEPEISLHPWALVILGEAMRLAAQDYNRQILVATHSPVLISQFSANDLVVAEKQASQARLRRVSELDDIEDLLEEYATGTLYMAGTLAPQDVIDEDDDASPDVES